MARTVNQQRRRQRREEITLAAAELFASQGFKGTSTAQIAKAAGVSTGNLFYYFPDKHSIFRAIFERDVPASRELFAAHADSADPVGSLLDVVDTLAAPARDHLAPGLLVELLRQAGEDARLLEVVAENESIVQEGVAGLVRQAGERGRVDTDLDVGEAAVWIRTMIDAVYLNARAESDDDPLPMLRLIITRFLGVDRAPQLPGQGKEGQ